ncbi:leucine-rich repeat protein [Salmonella enterica subsp. enterica]|uniref:Leucine-rich repeat protein n=1 Tax=Salmonella enterica I TaxID=59201 RepID=A0A447TZM5_SALET|nr:leucine-rich repeat protein [Salmonella enterica subsp. enterica]
MQKKGNTITISRRWLPRGVRCSVWENWNRLPGKKVRTLALVDEIEVWLAYQNKLKKSLGLTSVTSEMRFFDVSGVTVTDLQDAELQVKSR